MQPNQWQQQQYGYNPGFQQGMGQQPGGGPTFISTQPTGYPGAQQQRPMATGYGQSLGVGQPQPTGASTGGGGAGGAGGYAFLSAPPAAGSFGPQRSSFSNQSGLGPQMTGFPGGGASGLMSQPTGYGGGGLMSQPTGMPMGGMGGGLMSQPTGMGLRSQPTGMPHDPRLGAMLQSFMPSNASQPFSASGMPQFNQPSSQPLTQTFQTLLKNPSVNTPKVPWALSRQEKKDYDQIFRAWDTKGDGFISGEMAREVFGQAGLGQEDLMKIWNLADTGNRGKLNLPEFHIAMGLIYRALNGNQIPDTLPEELVPPSMRDIDTTVNFMKDLLKHESNTRSNTQSPVYGGTPVSAANSKDAKVYKHDDTRSGSYRSSSRHLDRKAVRYDGEDAGAEISDLRRQLENSSAMLDQSTEEASRRTEEDEILEQEVEDLKRRVRRIKEDLEYVSKGRQTQDKADERRKLEREMMFLMHEKLPELERRQKRREEDKRMEERAGIRGRDRRNDNHGRFNDRDNERDWLRGTYDRDRERERSSDRRGSYDRDRDRDRYDRDRERERDRDRGGYDRERDYGRKDSYARDRSREREYSRRDDSYGGDRSRERDSSRDRESERRAPSPRKEAPKPAPSPKPTPSPAPKPASMSSMTPEERKAYVKEQAQRRIQERLRALGVEPTPSEPTVDDSVEERLAREKAEAEEKAKAADREQEAREQARRERIAGLSGGATNNADEPAKSPAVPPTPPAKPAGKKPPVAPPSRNAKAAPPPPKPRAAPVAPTPPAPPSPQPPAPPAEDPEEAELRKQEEARQKAIAERRERLRRLQEEEEEEQRKEAELIAKRKARAAAVVIPEPAAAQSPPSTNPTSPTGGSYNPFHRKQTADSAAPAPSATPAHGGFNPFFRPPPAARGPSPAPPATQRSVAEPPAAPAPVSAPRAPSPPPPPPAPPAPAPPPAWPRVNSAPPPEDDWDMPQEKQAADSDSDSDEDYRHSSDKKNALASALFGGIVSQPTGSRPGSAPGTSGSPKPHAPPKEALAKLGGGAPSGGGMSALLSSIQGGARLKKAQTNDRSGPAATGQIIGDAAPPSHIAAGAPVVRTPSPLPSATEDDFEPSNPNRQSVDWYAGLAADASRPAASFDENQSLEPTNEEDEFSTPMAEKEDQFSTPVNEMADASISDGPSLDDVDLSKTLRVRTLYNYETSFNGDLPFAENVVIQANPAKDPNGPWWYGTLADGRKGWFPGSYVEECKVTPCQALYDYTGTGPEELSFHEGEQLAVVDQSDADWWKVERNNTILLVPAAYVEVVGARVVPSVPAQATQLQEPHTESPAPTPAVSASVPTDSAPAAHAAAEQHTNSPRSSELVSPTFKLDPPTDSASPVAPIPMAPITVTASFAYPPPTPPMSAAGRSRAASVLHYDVDDGDDGDESSEDSVLSWWSSDDEDSDTEQDVQAERDVAAAHVANAERERKDEERKQERKRREAERQRALAAAGLKIRREAPGIPTDKKRHPPGRRRPAPAVPVRVSGDPSHPAKPAPQHEPEPEPEQAAEPDIQVQDAYARYEQFLAEAKSRPPMPLRHSTAPRPGSGVFDGPNAAQSPQSPLPPPSPAPGGGRLTGFLSRMGVPTSLPTSLGGGSSTSPSTPRISGPIISGPISSPMTPVNDSPSPDGRPDNFGQTWSSLVDPSVLATMGERERKRQESIFEFIVTESTYVRDLQLIVEVYFRRMMDLIDERALTVIFANVEDILMFNSSFLSSLEERQKDCRLYVDVIGDVLQQHLQNLEVYRPYCVNQDQAAKLLVQLQREDARLRDELKDIQENEATVRGLDLASFLLEPMQRITRYPLLLKQIASYTTPDQDLEQVQRAQSYAERTTAHINEDVRENESRERLRVLSEDLWVGGEGRLDLTEPTQYQGPRRLIKEGPVSKAKSGRKLSMVLCTDVLIFIESRNLYRMPIPLHDLSVQQGRDDVSFAIAVGKDVVRLRAPSASERSDWVARIYRARKNCVAAREAAGPATRSHRRTGSDGSAISSRTANRRSWAPSIGSASAYSSPSINTAYPGGALNANPNSNVTSPYSPYTNPAPLSPHYPQTSSPPPLPPRNHQNYAPSLVDNIGVNPNPVYDDAHSYAGTKQSMYDHEF